MQAGKLNHIVTIEARTSQADGFVWQKFATVPAAIEPLSAREFLGANQVHGQADAKITIRWLDGVNASMRIRQDDDRIYNILGVLEDAKSGCQWITLPVSRGTNEG